MMRTASLSLVTRVVAPSVATSVDGVGDYWRTSERRIAMSAIVPTTAAAR